MTEAFDFSAYGFSPKSQEQIDREVAATKEAATKQDEFVKARLGNITASTVGDLMAGAQTAQTYLYKKIAERLTGVPCANYVSAAMEIGKQREAECIALLKAKTYAIHHALDEQLTVTIRQGFVATPDGFLKMPNGAIRSIETKCPNPETHAKYLFEVKCAETLKKVNRNYFWQVVTQMVAVFSHFESADFEAAKISAKGTTGYFISYHPDFMAKGDKRLHIVEIKPADADFDELFDVVSAGLIKIEKNSL